MSRSRLFGDLRDAPDASSSPTVFDPADLIESAVSAEPEVDHLPPVGKPHIHLVNA